MDIIVVEQRAVYGGFEKLHKNTNGKRPVKKTSGGEMKNDKTDIILELIGIFTLIVIGFIATH